MILAWSVSCSSRWSWALQKNPKKGERTTTSPKCIMSQQRSNNRRNEGERGRCVGQREKLHGRKTEQDNFRVVRDTVNGLFKGTFGHTTTSSRVRCPWLFGSSLSSSRSTTDMEILYFGSIPLSRSVALKALLSFSLAPSCGKICGCRSAAPTAKARRATPKS